MHIPLQGVTGGSIIATIGYFIYNWLTSGRAKGEPLDLFKALRTAIAGLTTAGGMAAAAPHAPAAAGVVGGYLGTQILDEFIKGGVRFLYSLTGRYAGAFQGIAGNRGNAGSGGSDSASGAGGTSKN